MYARYVYRIQSLTLSERGVKAVDLAVIAWLSSSLLLKDCTESVKPILYTCPDTYKNEQIPIETMCISVRAFILAITSYSQMVDKDSQKILLVDNCTLIVQTFN